MSQDPKSLAPAALVVAALVCAALARAALGQAPPAEVSLSSPYTDLLGGFTIRPPAGVERSNQRSPSQLVSWQRRDPKTAAVTWTLAVNKVNNVQEGKDLQEYSQSLAATLQSREAFKVESNQLTDVADHKAIDIKGHTEGRIQWWQRQVWVTTPPANRLAGAAPGFVTLRITGSPQLAGEMDAVMTTVLKSLEVLDVQQVLAQRQERLKAGAAFLKSLDPKKVAAALPHGTKYYLVHQGQNVVGYFITGGAPAREGGTDGFGIKIALWVASPDQSALMHLTAWAALDLSAEHWSQEIVTYRGKEPLERDQASSASQKGKMANGTIDCQVAGTTGSPMDFVKTAPRDIYLPLAWTVLLPRLVDANKPATLAFARYAAVGNSFDVHTITVAGRTELTLGDKKVPVTSMEVRPADNAPADTIYMAGNGDIVRMETGSGYRMDGATRAELLTAFPAAAKTLQPD